MIRVAHVSAYYAPAWRYGGPPRSIHGLCRALCRHGLEIRVFTTDADGPVSLPAAVTSAGAFEGVPVRYFQRSWPAFPIGSRALTLGLRAAMPSFDIVHIHGLWNRVTWSAAREARRAGIPYVVSPRGMLQAAARAHHDWRKKAVYAALERGTLERAALLHATSEDEVETLERMLTGRPVALIPNGVDLGGDIGGGSESDGSGSDGSGSDGSGRTRPTRGAGPSGRTRATSGAGPSGPAVLFVGRLHPIKRLDLLIDAFVQLRATHPAVRLAIAGPDEYGLRPGLERRAGAAGAAITWHGEVGAARRDELLRESVALVLCSDSESFGMSVLEAMAMATPAVVTSTCGWPDLERRGAGLRVAQRSDAIAAALARLLDDPAAAAAMGGRGRALAESAYTWPRVAKEFAARYQRLL